ncbi:hypothetical protein [Streptomyces mirabilis]|uniref:hypothetical protein n=1 Tax=Streptomyces mirabilis TaxID=68239 RepID=UPI00332CCB7B
MAGGDPAEVEKAKAAFKSAGLAGGGTTGISTATSVNGTPRACLLAHAVAP